MALLSVASRPKIAKMAMLKMASVSIVGESIEAPQNTATMMIPVA
jgi:hypothetical protein